MRQRSLLTDEVATTGHTMLQRYTQHLDATVFIDDLMDRCIYGVEHHLEVEIVGKEADLTLQLGAQGLRCMDMKTRRTPQQSEGGNHAYQTKAMITVKMGDEDMTQLGKPHTTPTQLHLRTLSTVEHQHLIAHLHYL